jgi:hypothetical protein
MRKPTWLLIGLAVACCSPTSRAADKDLSWPTITRTQKPWAYWWWMASAVDEKNISRELTRYRDGGLGGVHIIPIYGAKGFETNYIDYLSPRWMKMMGYTVKEADRLGLGVDMTTGSGWCFGGPQVTDDEANANVVVKQSEVAGGAKLAGTFDPKTTQALMAFGPDGKKIDLLPKLGADGAVNWTAEGGPWRVFAISQKPSGQKVKRAGPGGEGWMLNLFYPAAMTNYLRWFDDAFANYKGPKPRAQYHDSYEYRCDWSPDFFAQFERMRGYRLQDELPAMFGRVDDDRAGRVKCDYRETISELMSDVTLPMWVKWSHDHGFITRNEAHGSPGNLLDLYAVADVPETEMFHLDRNKLVSKVASSAAHVAGRPLTASETGTWLEEHFTETLADMKFLLDDLFLSGINHVFYHGLCYSPDEAGWPGWHFYASYEMNPRNSVWHDVPALNTYAARCQAVLQSGKPDNDILLYWPIYDRWMSPTGSVQAMTVHARDWLEQQPVGKEAEELWERGYAFDYVSDAQLKTAKVVDGKIQMPGGKYQVIVVPECKFIPLETFKQLLALAESGATVVFRNHLPADVPGLNDLEQRRREFRNLRDKLKFWRSHLDVSVAEVGKGSVLMDELSRPWYPQIKAKGEPLVACGLSFIRRSFDGGWNYFIANRTETNFEGWVTLSRPSQSAAILDPMTGNCGIAAQNANGQIHLQLNAGGSVILRAFAGKKVSGTPWSYSQANGQSVEIGGDWKVKFIEGGPEFPADFQTSRLSSWTALGDTNAQRFAGSALYSVKFDAPAGGAKEWQLDLGKVCQSARVRLNGSDLGTLITPPFRVAVDKLKRKGNLLEVEVTNVSANRIRDLDRRGVKWKTFNDINVVNLAYQPFNAANWPLTDSGLLGPVTLTPLKMSAMK